MKKWKYLAAAALISFAAFMSACGGKNSDGAKNEIPSVIRVGSETTFPPFAFTKDDKYTGFDIELAEAVVKQIGSRMELKSMEFDMLIPALEAGQIDLVAAAMDVTAEREKKVAFSDVYFTDNSYVLVVRRDTSGIDRWVDLENRKTGCQVGTEPERLAKQFRAKVVPFDGNDKMMKALRENSIDAVMIDQPAAKYFLRQRENETLMTTADPMQTTGMAFAISKKNEKLRDAVNKALKELKESGAYDKLYQKWFGE